VESGQAAKNAKFLASLGDFASLRAFIFFLVFGKRSEEYLIA
jgi:hypothetical protein